VICVPTGLIIYVPASVEDAISLTDSPAAPEMVTIAVIETVVKLLEGWAKTSCCVLGYTDPECVFNSHRLTNPVLETGSHRLTATLTKYLPAPTGVNPGTAVTKVTVVAGAGIVNPINPEISAPFESYADHIPLSEDVTDDPATPWGPDAPGAPGVPWGPTGPRPARGNPTGTTKDPAGTTATGLLTEETNVRKTTPPGATFITSYTPDPSINTPRSSRMDGFGTITICVRGLAIVGCANG
jgi:hypothetical protein